MFESWKEPLPLATIENGKLILNTETLKLLNEISQELVIVTIAGTYRGGKSYLMNRLAQKPKGFCIGGSLETQTRGIWIWCKEHPTQKKRVLALMDTEGLDNAQESNEDQDVTIMTLAILISSAFIFNTTGRIDSSIIEKLHFVTDIVDKVDVRAKQNKEAEEDQEMDYLKHFPTLILAIRDFSLELKLGDKEVTPDEYFEDILKYKDGAKKKMLDYNYPRKIIRNAFKEHRCFVFSRPVSDDLLLKRLDDIGDEDLNQSFLLQIKKFCQYIYQETTVKKCQSKNINGKVFASMTEEYVKCINTGAIPCIEPIMNLVAQRENERIMKETKKIYKEEMDKLHLPVTSNILSKSHTAANDKAMDYFIKNSFNDNEKKYMNSIQLALPEEYSKYIQLNDAKSEEKCTEILNKLYDKDLASPVKNGDFSRSGGYERYKQLMQGILNMYYENTKEEIKSTDVANKFISEKESERQIILIADNNMTDAERKNEKLKHESEDAAREMKLKKEELENQKVINENLQKTQEENIKKLQEDYENRQKEYKKEMDQIIENRVKETERLAKEGYEMRAKEMKEEIEKLKIENNSLLLKGIEVLGSSCSKIADSYLQHKSFKTVYKMFK